MKNPFPILIVLIAAALSWGHGISESQHQAMLEGGNLRYMWLGAVHMLTGYDHLLFLFGVIFYLTGFRDILKFITVFTLGHSITLIFATYAGITANYYLVDAVIALSVCYKAFDNLEGFPKYLKIASPNRVLVVFAFGLVHGFGLSTRLQQLPLGDDGLLARILSFNVGVEAGQIAALAALVLLLAGIRTTTAFARLGKAANILLLAAGLGLFAYQMQGYLSGGGNVDVHHEEQHQESHDDTKTGMHSHDGGAPHSHDVEPRNYDVPLPPDATRDTAAVPEAGPKPHSHHGGEPHTH